MVPGFGETAERLRRSTVQITIGKRSSGSGVIWTTGGTIVTNAHVASEDRVDVKLWDGRSYPGTVTARDLRRDLAKLQVKALDLPAVTPGDSHSLRIGELVIAVGNPLGFIGALTTGVLHALGPIPQLGRLPWVQADVRLAPGNSGGPLADAQGRVIGINTMVAGGLALAIPSHDVAAFLEKGASSPLLGVVLRPVWLPMGLNPRERRFGLMILEIKPASAAERASLFPGDILTGVDGKAIQTPDDLADALQSAQNRVLRLQFIRGNRAAVREVAVEFGPGRAEAA
jgi:serine protease Do